jgi:cyclophilin family peptidyl-prolyl cis-trans isomerase
MQRKLIQHPIPFRQQLPEQQWKAADSSVKSGEQNSRAQRRSRLIEELELRQVFAAPTLSPLADVNLLSGAPLQIALDGLDTDGDNLTFEVQSSNSNIVPVLRASTNRSLEFNVTHTSSGTPGDSDLSGKLVFQLFDDLVPGVTNRIATLADSGFYDGIVFHRILNNFVMQAGDPLGNGTGGSGVRFDDVFNPDLQHTVTGLLSMAKSSDDTNDSQFFITEGPTRHLDFNHSIFGMLTEGEALRDALSNIPVQSNGGSPPENSSPVSPVTISSARTFVNTQDGVLTLKAANGYTGSATITVTVRDGNGGVATRTFNVSATPDTTNANAYFASNPTEVRVVANGSTNFQFQSVSVDNIAVVYGGILLNSADSTKLDVNVNSSTGLMTVTAKNGFVGVVPVYVGVTSTDFSSESVYDAQTIPVLVVPSAPTSIDLLDGSDTGVSNSDNLTNNNNSTAAKQMTFRVSGVTSGHTVRLLADGVVIGEAVAAGTTVDVTTNGTVSLANGARNITAISGLVAQQINVGSQNRTADLMSDPSSPLVITLDGTGPAFSTSPTTTARASIAYSYDPLTDDEGGAGFSYALITGPSGMNINNASGLISWTPTLAQQGTANNVTIRAIDRAGNFTDQSFTINVAANSTPTLPAIAIQNINEGVLYSFTAVGNDADLPNDTLTYSLVNSPSNASINATTGLFSITPTEQQGGTALSATIRVTDAQGLFAEQTFTLNVGEVNASPTITQLNDQSAATNALFSVSVNASDSDLPAQTLSYSLITAPSGMTISNAGLIEWTPPANLANSSQQVTVAVSDNNGGTAQMTFTVNVQQTPIAPALDPVSDQNASEGQELTIQLNGTDANLPFDSLTYSIFSGPSNATINATTGLFSFTPNELQGGTSAMIVVRVTDGSGLFFDRSFNVTIAETNTAPVIPVIPTQSATENSAFTLDVLATDADLPANNLVYSLLTAPAGMSINTLGQINWTPGETHGGNSYNITVRVNDQAGGVTDRNFTINVAEQNQAPVTGSPISHSVNELATLNFTVTATDADLPAQALTYSLINAPSGVTINSSTGQVSWTPTEAQGPALHTFQVRVTDSLGAFSNQTVNVTVNEVNRAPTLAAISDSSGFQNAVFNSKATGSDADLPTQSLSYSLLSAPSGMTINSATGDIRWSIPGNYPTGVYAVRVQVNDGLATAIRGFNVEVKENSFGPIFALFPQGNITQVTAPSTEQILIPNDTPLNSLAEIVTNFITTPEIQGSTANTPVNDLISGPGRLQAVSVPESELQKERSQEVFKPEIGNTPANSGVIPAGNQTPAPEIQPPVIPTVPVIPTIDAPTLPVPPSSRVIKPSDAAIVNYLLSEESGISDLAVVVGRQASSPYADLKQQALTKIIRDEELTESEQKSAAVVPTTIAAGVMLGATFVKTKMQPLPLVSQQIATRKERWKRT